MPKFHKGGPLQTGLNALRPTKKFKSQTLFWRVPGIQSSWILLNMVKHSLVSNFLNDHLTNQNGRRSQCFDPNTIGISIWIQSPWERTCAKIFMISFRWTIAVPIFVQGLAVCLAPCLLILENRMFNFNTSAAEPQKRPVSGYWTLSKVQKGILCKFLES